MKQIIVKVSPEGQVVVDAKGFKGKSCEDATKALLSALSTDDSGKTVTKKPEFYQVETTTPSLKIGI